MTETEKKIVSAVKRAKKIAVFSHMRPDGDTFGSALAFKFSSGVPTDIYVDSEIAPYHGALPGIGGVISCRDLADGYDLLIAVDCGDKPRLGRYEKPFLAHKNTINIDHHVTNTRFGTINFIRPKASSACELVFPVILSLSGGKLSRDTATALYAGLSTDTGNFTHSNTSARTFRVASRLAASGVNIPEMARKLYKETTFARLKLLSRALDGMFFREGGRVAVMTVTYAMLNENGCKSYDTEGFIDYAANTQGAAVGVLIQEIGRDNYKIGLRCLPPLEVSRVAAEFGGGGHKQASGFTLAGRYDEVVEKILWKIRTLW